MVDAGGAASRVSNALVPLGEAASSGAIEMRDFGDGVFRAAGGAEAATRSFSAFGRSMGDSALGGGLGSWKTDPRTQFAGMFDGLTSGMRSMASSASELGDKAEEGIAGSLGGGLQSAGMGALYATAGIALLDAGVGALGAGA
jgi:hypothetical protein